MYRLKNSKQVNHKLFYICRRIVPNFISLLVQFRLNGMNSDNFWANGLNSDRLRKIKPEWQQWWWSQLPRTIPNKVSKPSIKYQLLFLVYCSYSLLWNFSALLERFKLKPSLQRLELQTSTEGLSNYFLSLYRFWLSCLDMLFSGILLGSSKLATQYGDGLALIAYWKNSIRIYHKNGKVVTFHQRRLKFQKLIL